MSASPSPGRRRWALRRAARSTPWILAVVLALGATGIGLLIATDQIRERLVGRDVALVRATDGIEKQITSSHLWVEEYVTGDEVDRDLVEGSLEAALGLARGMVEGEPPAGGPAGLRPLTDPGLRRRAIELQSRVQAFADLSRERYRLYGQGEEVGIGSEIDRRYDALFFDLLAGTESLEKVFSRRLAANARRSRLLFRTILLAWVAIVALAVTGLWTRERRRRRAEAALEKSRAQLLQAQKMEAVGRLAGGIAHDINNYLGAITGQCELVRMKAEPGSALTRRMDAVVDTAFRASALIRQLLAFSRQQPTALEVVDLNGVIRGLLPMMERLLGADVALATRLGQELWTVDADPSQLEQVLVNLLVNSREAMLTGGRVIVRTENHRLEGEAAAAVPGTAVEPPLRPGEYVLLTVIDDGPGIPAAIRDKIFEPFFSTKDPAGGASGLGLATVYGIVRGYGGHLWVYSEEGHGTAFKIYLPRSRGEAARTPAVALPEPAAAGGSERILLVEDNDDLRTSTSAVLGALGYQVTVAGGGGEALGLLAEGGTATDLVITDVVMPGMSGRELVDEIARRQPPPRVIFVSGYTDDVVLRHGIAEGEVDFLQKPFSAEALARKVREVLSREDRGAQAPGG